MNKLKSLFVALALLAASVLHAGPQTANDILQGAQRENAPKSKYLVAFGKILAKKSGSGWTTFSYRDGKVASETSPENVIGTYIYDHTGKIDEIQYNNGKRVRVGYNSDGRVTRVSTDGRRSARFGADAPRVPAGKEKLGNFVYVQEGMEAMQFCDTGNLDSDCTIIIVGEKPGGGGDFGNGDNFGGFYPRFPGAGGGGGGFGGSSSTPRPELTPEQCKAQICDGGQSSMLEYCRIATRTPDTYRRCRDKAFEYYAYCLRSCSSGDWAWLDLFNYVW